MGAQCRLRPRQSWAAEECIQQRPAYCRARSAGSCLQLRPAASSDRAASTQAAEPRPPLVHWVLSRGGSVSGATIANLAGRDGGSGWGLVSTQDLKPGARLIELPASCHLTYSAASTDPALLQLIEQVPEELWGARLALQLLQHRVRGAASPFAPYIAQLPIGFPGVPLFFGRSAIDALEYPPVVEQIKKRGRWLFRFTSDHLSKLPGSSADPYDGTPVDLNALGWAMAAVTSRAFRVHGPSQPASMLPLIDMANHSFDPNCEVLPDRRGAGGVAMVAKRGIAAGEPLLLSYGPLSNDFLLLDYGFVVPGNPHDRAALRFDVELITAGAIAANVPDPSDPAMPLSDLRVPAWKQAVLRQLALWGPGARLEVLLGGPQHVEPRLLAAARVLLAQFHSEVDGLELAVLGDWERPLNRANEAAVLRSLAGVCSIVLARFSSSLNDDQDALKAGRVQGQQQQQQQPAELSEEMRLAVLFRSQRKQVLVSTLQALAARVQELGSIPGLKPSALAPVRKGSAPRPATNKGFGRS